MAPFSPHSGNNSSCTLRTFGVVEASADALAALRKEPGPPGGLALPPNLLNHADDQTVAAVAAVLRAIHDGGLSEQAFTDWAVVGAPRFPGRRSFAVSLDKFRQQGPLSVSPLIIPFQSLHALSSMISLALHIHGPSLGVGGGIGGIRQALLLGLSLAAEQDAAGVWVVVTGWDPEAIPRANETDGRQPVCRAAALALLPQAVGAFGSRLRLVPRATTEQSLPGLPDLVRFLAGESRTNRSWNCPLDAACNLELTLAERGAYLAPLARSA